MASILQARFGGVLYNQGALELDVILSIEPESLCCLSTFPISFLLHDAFVSQESCLQLPPRNLGMYGLYLVTESERLFKIFSRIRKTSMRWSSADISGKAKSLRAKLSSPWAASAIVASINSA